MRPAVVPFLPQLVFVRGQGHGTRLDYSDAVDGKLVQVSLDLLDLFRHPGVVGFVGEDEPTPVSDVELLCGDLLMFSGKMGRKSGNMAVRIDEKIEAKPKER